MLSFTRHSARESPSGLSKRRYSDGHVEDGHDADFDSADSFGEWSGTESDGVEADDPWDDSWDPREHAADDGDVYMEDGEEDEDEDDDDDDDNQRSGDSAINPRGREGLGRRSGTSAKRGSVPYTTPRGPRSQPWYPSSPGLDHDDDAFDFDDDEDEGLADDYNLDDDDEDDDSDASDGVKVPRAMRSRQGYEPLDLDDLGYDDWSDDGYEPPSTGRSSRRPSRGSGWTGSPSAGPGRHRSARAMRPAKRAGPGAMVRYQRRRPVRQGFGLPLPAVDTAALSRALRRRMDTAREAVGQAGSLAATTTKKLQREVSEPDWCLSLGRGRRGQLGVLLVCVGVVAGRDETAHAVWSVGQGHETGVLFGAGGDPLPMGNERSTALGSSRLPGPCCGDSLPRKHG